MSRPEPDPDLGTAARGFFLPCGRGFGGISEPKRYRWARRRRPVRRRPAGPLRSLALMTIAAVLIGIVVGIAIGGAAVSLALRGRLVGAQRAAARAGALDLEVRALERRAIEAEAQLDAERGTLDQRVASAVRTASAEAMKESSGRVPRPGPDQAGRVRRTAARVPREGGDAGHRARERPQAGLRLADGEPCARSARSSSACTARRATSSPRCGRRTCAAAGARSSCAASSRWPGWSSTATSSSSRRRRDGDGRMLRPDVIVRLPGGKQVVIDSKVPLAAYLDAVEDATTTTSAQPQLAEHARHVREHILKLGQKALLAAARRDARVRRDVPPGRVVPPRRARARPLAHRARRREQRDPRVADEPDRAAARGALRLAAGDDRGGRAEDLRPRPRALQAPLDDGQHVSKLGRSLDGAVRAFNETVGSLERQVLPQARRFEQHGITGITPDELVPIERQTRVLAAAELVPADEPREELPGRRPRGVTAEHRAGPDSFPTREGKIRPEELRTR